MALVSLLATAALADEDLTLVDIIDFSFLDSAKVTSVTPVGDFNADGYDDLLIGIRQWPIAQSWLEAAFLYYGGLDFDTDPDLIFIGEPNSDICNPPDITTSFGRRACGLGDFNGDGYDDIAISAAGMCVNDMYDGRIYCYFGSPEPDTIVDLIINGEEFRDFLGRVLIAGDFNGDGLGDLFTYANGTWLLSRAIIYTGNDPPDAEHDFLYDSTRIEDENIYGGSDLNNDGYDEFGWATYDSVYLFLGGNPLDNNCDFTINGFSLFLPGDISRDGIDDFMKGNYDGWHLCLGGEPFNVEPDYYMGLHGLNVYLYNAAGLGTILFHHSWNIENKFYFYNTGVPFDTIPIAVFNFEGNDILPVSGYGVFIGDIDNNGNDDIVLAGYNAEARVTNTVNIYSLISTDIKDTDQNNDYRQDTKILYCYPNPFNTSTTINFGYNYDVNSEMTIYNLRGEIVKKLKANKKKGVIWKADDLRGNNISSGIYFIKVDTPFQSFTIKVTYLK